MLTSLYLWDVHSVSFDPANNSLCLKHQSQATFKNAVSNCSIKILLLDSKLFIFNNSSSPF